jgi:leucyl aminopeptidase (aminopeptidase T)
VHIIGPNGKRRNPLSSGTDVREKIDKDFLKEGIVAGTYGNVPGGEAFMTPEFIEGTFIGDVVISIDRSYAIPKSAPLVIQCSKEGHRIISGDKKILLALNRERNISLKQLNIMERNKAVSKEIADLKKRNFYKIGEFAINTNPKARLCDYLIVNEKIANMMHIALGSGFDADRSSTYHYDIVMDAKGQKMDVFGEKDGEKIWILKGGHFVV